ncbi:MAG: glycosyltransferase family 4 protein [Candidatus Omnitrophota bacterium]|nr:glycosyltransferase family 4 protein [Candidatus Omnitrophota bacterium]MBU2035598.1 glycosyltransferase family 4 protein [Candidatus Omnitrophota bacterium]MBU2258021.1 glycosyltransferase family 4 protein [Candidatus Omnitrophota bacterium]
MNILFLSTHLNTGGISSYLLSLSKGLKDKGHNIYLASSSGELLDEFKGLGVDFLSIPIKTKSEADFFKILSSLFRLQPYIEDNHIDIIHSHTRVTQVLGCLVKKYSHIAHVTTCHGFFKNRLSRRIFPCWGDKVIAISEQVEEHLIRDFGLKKEQIRLVNNGIDVDKFKIQSLKIKEDARKRLGLKKGPVAGIVARLSNVKGHIYLIRAIRQAKLKFPEAQLLIVGEGKIKNDLLRLTRELDLTDSVIFLANVTDTREVLSAMDVFVLPSLKEGLGLGLMEAMACGLAVIGTDVGGIKSLIRDRENGILVKPADENSLAQAISELFSDPLKRESLGAKASDFIKNKFSLERMVVRTEEVYRECLSARP